MRLMLLIKDGSPGMKESWMMSKKTNKISQDEF